MRILCAFAVAFLISTIASTGSERASAQTGGGAEHLSRATEFERIGMLPEAQAEYLAGLADTDPTLHQKCLSGLQNIRMLKAARIAEMHMALGQADQDAREWDKASAEYSKAMQIEDWTDRESAARGIATVALEKESIYEKFGRGWLYPITIKVILSVASVFLVMGILRLIRAATSAASNRIEVREFDDPAQTGLGSTFPALIRERLLSSLALRKPAFAFLRGKNRYDPVIASRAAIQLPNVELAWSGVKIADALAMIWKLAVVPRYILDGSVSKNETQVRISVEMIRRGQLLRAWSFDSSQDFGDCAYEVSYALLRDYA